MADISSARERAIDIMEEVADWLDSIQPEGDVVLHGIPGDYRILVGELRIAIADLQGSD